MTDQLSLEIVTGGPGYYSWWARNKTGCAGSGAVTWHPSEDAAREYAIACFNRGYAKWPEDQKPKVHHVDVSLLRAGADIGRWGDLTQEQRNNYTKDHPWFADRERTSA